jgi:hypothetical protein
LLPGPEVDHRRALDEAARLQVDAPLAVLQGQFDPVAEKRLTGEQLILGRAMGGAEGGDQADARGVAPDQHRGAGHHVAVGAGRDADAVVAGGGVFDHPFEALEGQVRIAQGMGEVEDRVVGLLPVDAVQLQPLAGLEPVEHHLARLPHRGKLRGIAEEDEGGKDLGQVLELARVEHGAFVDEADVERAVPAFPAGDEIRPAQAGGGQRGGNRFRGIVDRPRPVERGVGQGLDHRTLALPGEPFGDLLVFRVVDRGIEDAVDRRRGHAPRAQDARRLVGGGEDRHGAPVLAAAALPVARDDLEPSGFQRLDQFRQQERLARPRLADHRQHVGLALGHGRDRAAVDIHAEAPQALGDAVMGFGLFVGEDGRGCSHGPDPSRPRADARGAVHRGGTIKSLDHPTPCLGSACPSR